MTHITADFLVIGAGIAGSAAAYWLAQHGSVHVLERESQPGYHSTGRSAAQFMESYGSPQVRALTRASRAFLQQPPAGFTDQPILIPRDTLIIAGKDDMPALQAEWQTLSSESDNARLLDKEETCRILPILRPELVAGAILDTDTCDIEVHALHQGFLRGIKQAGSKVTCNAGVTAISRQGNMWQVQAGEHSYQAPVIVNAAGAWGDEIAALAGATLLGLQPKRRSAFTFDAPKDMNAHLWPFALGVLEDWYIKPDAGQMIGSPANTDPVAAHDVQPEELDIAMGIYRIEEATTLQIRRPSHTWAGLRTFAPDGDLVNGFDAQTPGFYWLVGQGGYGIQTSAAMGQAAAALLAGQALPEHLQAQGLTAAMLSPARLAAKLAKQK